MNRNVNNILGLLTLTAGAVPQTANAQAIRYTNMHTPNGASPCSSLAAVQDMTKAG